MSQIRKDLEKLGSVSINDGEDMQSYLRRLLDAVDEKLAEDDALGSKAKGLWDKLSEGVQAFFNAGMEAYNKKTDIAEFPDVEKKAERAKRDDVKVKEEVDVLENDGHEHVEIDDLKDGDDVIVECKDESVFRGTVVEVTKRVVVLTLSEDGKEEEMVIKRDNVEDVIKAPKQIVEEMSEVAEKATKASGKMVKSKDAEKGKKYLVDIGDNSLVECECVRVMSETTVFESNGERYKIEHDAEVECCFSDEVQTESENIDKDVKSEVKTDEKEKKVKEPKPVKEKKVKVSITDKRIENANKVAALMNELGLDDSEKRKVCSRIYSTIAKNSKE